MHWLWVSLSQTGMLHPVAEPSRHQFGDELSAAELMVVNRNSVNFFVGLHATLDLSRSTANAVWFAYSFSLA